MQKSLVAVAIAGLCLLLWTLPASAADVVVTFDDPDQSTLYHSLLKEYRCLKCQNQNLSDSNASLAGDLRREIRDQILAGKEKEDIDDYLVARYGDFVLYRPRFSAKTAILWIAPFVLLLVAISSIVIMIRRRPARLARGEEMDPEGKDIQGSDDQRLEKARKLLEN